MKVGDAVTFEWSPPILVEGLDITLQTSSDASSTEYDGVGFQVAPAPSGMYFKSKSNLYYTRGITPKHVTSGGAHLRSLAPGQHAETSQRWRAVGDTVFNVTGLEIDPTPPNQQRCFNNCANCPVVCILKLQYLSTLN